MNHEPQGFPQRQKDKVCVWCARYTLKKEKKKEKKKVTLAGPSLGARPGVCAGPAPDQIMFMRVGLLGLLGLLELLGFLGLLEASIQKNNFKKIRFSTVTRGPGLGVSSPLFFLPKIIIILQI